ncbi:MAG: hypothetical protein EB165_03545 [Euryarchaeota archaeon]|jgi:hypothetical protein|nr:hypothetical protein [Euryarchaeota archaeon]
MGQGSSEGKDPLLGLTDLRNEPKDDPCPYSVWDLIEIIDKPDDWAITVKNGELYIAERQQIEALGIVVKGA